MQRMGRQKHEGHKNGPWDNTKFLFVGGSNYVGACEPEENPTHAQGHMDRLLHREPGEVGRKATKRKAPDYNRAPPSSLTPSKSTPKTESKKWKYKNGVHITRGEGQCLY